MTLLRNAVVSTLVALALGACSGTGGTGGESADGPEAAETVFCSAIAEAVTIGERIVDGSDLPTDVLEPLRELQLRMEEVEASYPAISADTRPPSDYVARARDDLARGNETYDIAGIAEGSYKFRGGRTLKDDLAEQFGGYC